METALEGLQGVDHVSVTGSAGDPWTVTFGGTTLASIQSPLQLVIFGSCHLFTPLG